VTDPTVPIAFLAGLISFLSPCVLPLVPGYLSYMTGLGPADAPGGGGGLRAARAAVFFVLGFTGVFVALGATATLLGALLRSYQTLLTRAGGVFIILLGLVFMGVLRFPPLYREARFHPTPAAGAWGSLVLGGAFAFGWSPCIGATMGAILAMAAGRGATGGPGEGAMLLAVYSIGLGVPFILAGAGVAHLAGAVKWLARRTRAVNLVSGAGLVIVGALFVSGQLFRLAILMQKGFLAMNLDFLARI
jgi:cytochrome c-type biogenesis protein